MSLIHTRVRQLMERLQKEAQRQGYSTTALSEATGLHQNTLIGFKAAGSRSAREWRPNVHTIERIERVLLPPLKPQKPNRRLKRG